jgi:hypothetical protein
MIRCIPGFATKVPFFISLAGVREVVLPAVDDVSSLDDPDDRPGAAESRTRPPPTATTPLPLTVSDGNVYFLAYNRVKNIFVEQTYIIWLFVIIFFIIFNYSMRSTKRFEKD